tara:strand:- start:736 stop:1413 length:678 start_codon:yes stop_codon:yes gene_type:complete
MKGELTKAHGQFLKDVGTIHKEAKAQYGKFADLAGILSVVNPKLVKNGLSVHQTFRFTDSNQHVLITHLNHISGESLSSEILMPINQGRNPLHDFGGAVSYCRRYSLLAILGLQAGIEEDDGDHADDKKNDFISSQIAMPKQAKQEPAKTDEIPEIIPNAQRMELLTRLGNLAKSTSERDIKLFHDLELYCRKNFPIPPNEKFSSFIQEKRHLLIIEDYLRASRK